MAPRVINAVPNAIHEMGHPTNSAAIATEVFAGNPCVMAINNGQVTVPAIGGGMVMPYTSEMYDVGGMHDNLVNNSRITIVVPGVYYFLAQTEFEPNTNGTRSIRFLKDGGSTSFVARGFAFPSGSSDLFLQVAAMMKLIIGDYVEVEVTNDSGIDLGTVDNFFSAVRVAGG